MQQRGGRLPRRWIGSGAIALVLGLAAPAFAAPGDPVSIIGGTTTAVGQYPSVVGLTIGSNLCTGTLIAPSWVMTAGHCVDPDVLGLGTQDRVTANMTVYFNTVDITTDSGRMVSATGTYKDAGFNRNRLGSNDLGLIQLATPVTDIAPSPINLMPSLASVGTLVTLVGFGSQERGGGGVRGAELDLKNRSVVSCGSVAVAGSDDNLLCFSQADNKGTCSGDSGGPAFAMIGGRQTIVGVTSFGDQQCATYGADTRIDAEQTFLAMYLPDLVGCLDNSGCPAQRICFEHACIAEPFGPAGLGSVCTAAADCDSAVCAQSSEDGNRCSVACSPGDSSTCPDGFECLKATVGGGACWPVAGGGCCDAGGSSPATAVLGLGAVVLALGGRRRRRA